MKTLTGAASLERCPHYPQIDQEHDHLKCIRQYCWNDFSFYLAIMYIYSSPLGKLRISINDGFISDIFFPGEKSKFGDPSKKKLSIDDNKVLNQCCKQLDEYFKGSRKEFDFPFRQTGTLFQLMVWNELLKIPYGKTISYLQLSQRIGNKKAIRAVGTANGRNHLPIVVPCHRVIGSNGSLTGYGGGLWRKQWLLEHESKFAHGVNLLF